MLTKAELDARVGTIGSSDCPMLMNDVEPVRLAHWFDIKVGAIPPDPETWAMRAGSILGDPILDEYERQIGRAITRRQERVVSPFHKNAISTIDGWDDARKAVIEAKFASPFFAREQIFGWYYAQVSFQMLCCGAERGFLVVAQGTADPFEIECLRDAEYERELQERITAMLLCIATLTPPVVLPAPIPPERWRTVDIITEPTNWGAELIDELRVYEDTKPMADAHEAAGKAARGLVPDDVGKVLAGPFTISRNKKGTLTITRRAA